MLKCWGCALTHGPMPRRSSLIALVVGTILIAINQGDLLLRDQWNDSLLWKVPFTHAVPFLVATWSALINGARSVTRGRAGMLRPHLRRLP